MAAPVVAGALALVWSEFPELTSTEVINKIYDTAIDVDHRNWPWNRGGMGHGRVDLREIFK